MKSYQYLNKYNKIIKYNFKYQDISEYNVYYIFSGFYRINFNSPKKIKETREFYN